MSQITFSYEAVRYNGVNGYLATKHENAWDDRGYQKIYFKGQQFGKTKKAAREAIDAKNDFYSED